MWTARTIIKVLRADCIWAAIQNLAVSLTSFCPFFSARKNRTGLLSTNFKVVILTCCNLTVHSDTANLFYKFERKVEFAHGNMYTFDLTL